MHIPHTCQALLPSAHISLLSLTLFSPPLSLSSPSLNLSRSHLQGNHPSFVLLPSLTSSCLCQCLCLFSVNLCRERTSPASFILLFSLLLSKLCIFTLCVWIPASLLSLSTCGEVVLLLLIVFFVPDIFPLSYFQNSVLLMHLFLQFILHFSTRMELKVENKKTWE